MSFSKLGLNSALLKNLAAQLYQQPYPIQQQAIPAILDKKDLLAIAPTGSGKTASYVLPILQLSQRELVSKNRHISVLVLVPTRELALQVEDVFKTFSYGLAVRIKSLAVHGGVAINPQMLALQNVHILVATPGRLLELVESNAVHLSSINTLVLDEADKMLNLGFKEEMTRIFELLPRKRQNLLLSATLNPDVEAITQFILQQPLVIKITPEPESIDSIKQTAYLVSDDKKGPLLRQLIQEKAWKQVLVFTSSTYKADWVANKLRINGIDAAAIHGQRRQNARRDALQAFKDGTLQVLVSTDLLARGIDIALLPAVVNYELPRSPKDYIHRIGRTGRAGAEGEAISLITPEEEHHFYIIQKKMGKRVEIIEA